MKEGEDTKAILIIFVVNSFASNSREKVHFLDDLGPNGSHDCDWGGALIEIHHPKGCSDITYSICLNILSMAPRPYDTSPP